MSGSEPKNWGYPTDTNTNLQVPAGDMEQAAAIRRKTSEVPARKINITRLVLSLTLILLLVASATVFFDMRKDEFEELSLKLRLYWNKTVQSIKSGTLFSQGQTGSSDAPVAVPEKPVWRCNGAYTDRPDDPAMCEPVKASRVKDHKGNEYFTPPWKGDKSTSTD